MTDCPICRNTGIAHGAPHISGLSYTITACTCEAGRALMERVSAETAERRARQMTAQNENLNV